MRNVNTPPRYIAHITPNDTQTNTDMQFKPLPPIQLTNESFEFVVGKRHRTPFAHIQTTSRKTTLPIK